MKSVPKRSFTTSINCERRTGWTYDGNGNRVSADTLASTFDAQDRQLTAGATTFAHDAFGNRIRKTESGQVTQYVYDGVGGLLSATLPDSTRLEYVIDARGRRVGKKRNGVLEKGWLYDGQLRIVAELDGAGAVVSRFVYGSLSHSPDVMVRGGVVYRYVHDVLGSVRLVIDTGTGQVAQRLDYDSWGVVTADSRPGFQPFGFAGGLHDVDTRLTRFGARDYDAATGRWMSKDPIAFGGETTNLYEYVSNNPVQHSDPSGLLNPTKLLSSLGNAANAGRLFAGGVTKGVAALVTSETILGGIGLGVWSAFNFAGSRAALLRGERQWKEAWDEPWCNSTPVNFLGMLPLGTEYDDPWETTATDAIIRKIEKFERTEVGEYLGEIASILF